MAKNNTEPIAVIGLDVRLCQDATSPESFWEMLCKGRSGVSAIPRDRFNIDAFYHEDPTRTDAINTTHAHFMKEDVATFDAPFFGISPEEASIMDPQQRGLLEVTYRALESGGIPIEKIAGTNTSVYTASFARDHDTMLTTDAQSQSAHHLMGVVGTMLANRLSHFFDFQGPSLALDTACSSSLYALHLACESLRSGESTQSVVGGSNLILTPETMMLPLSNAGILSPDGVSYSFDHRANGYARGEGIAVVVLKRLDKAIADGNTIRSIIRATGVNHDGRTPSLTAPSMAAQEALIRRTYDNEGLDLAQTKFFEAHGTGTAIGDPKEAEIIGRVFKDSRPPENPLIVGAVKSNVGHLEGASGLVALVKVTLMLEKGLVPPNTWFEKVNPAIDTQALRLTFPRTLEPWPSTGMRQASVSNFGYGGSNAHMVVQDSLHYLKAHDLEGIHHTAECSTRCRPELPPPGEATSSSERFTAGERLKFSREGSFGKILAFSAADEEGTSRQAASLQNHFASRTEMLQKSQHFDDVAYTLGSKRSLLPWRSFAVLRSLDDGADNLSQSLSKANRPSKPPSLGFVFTGQGAQWPGMGRELLKYTAFRESMNTADRFMQELGSNWSLNVEICREDATTQLHDPALSQPACTCLQVALVDMLRSWEICPDTVVGHSSGEIAAAYCANYISRESAWKIAYFRGVVAKRIAMSDPHAIQAMLAINLSESEAAVLLEELQIESSVSIGCVNSPSSVTMTGLKVSILKLKAELDRREVFARLLEVNVAYHSKYVAGEAITYRDLLQDIKPPCSPTEATSRVGVYSSVTGQEASLSQMSSSQYWVDNLVSKVQFYGAMQSLFLAEAQSRKSVQLVELGPHPALQRSIKDIIGKIAHKQKFAVAPTMRKGEAADESLLTMVGTLWTEGLGTDLNVINNPSGSGYRPQTVVDLPQYPFRPQRYWMESRLYQNFRFRSHGRHELLGTMVDDWNSAEPKWRNLLRSKEMPWINDHGFNEQAVYPASGMIVMALEAVRQLSQSRNDILGYRLRHVKYLKPLLLSKDGPTETTIHLQRQPGPAKPAFPWYDFRIFGFNHSEAVLLCHGLVQAEPVSAEAGKCGVEKCGASSEAQLAEQEHQRITRRCVLEVNHDQLYANMNEIGFHYGPFFQLLRSVKYSKNGDAHAVLPFQDWTRDEHAQHVQSCVIHPTTLDGILHLPIAAFSEGGWKAVPTMVASKTEDIWISHTLLARSAKTMLETSTCINFKGYREMSCNIHVLDKQTSQVVISIKNHKATVSAAFDKDLPTERGMKKLCYSLNWKPDPHLLTNSEAHTYFQSHFKNNEYLSSKSVDLAESLCYHFISKVTESADFHHFKGDPEYLTHYANWMRGILQQPESRFADQRCIQAEIRRVLESEEQDNAFLKMVIKIGHNLVQIFNGTVSPLQLLFEDALADDFYRITTRSIAVKIAHYIDILAHENPSLRILEVGAGTGASTHEILSTLSYEAGDQVIVPRFEEYAYTDISPGFFEKAKQQFTHYGNVTYKTLDISIDPESQGFARDSYDVVVAGSVLHATPSLQRTLRNVRKLLKPDGRLLLSEQCNTQRISDKFIFGTLPGWWLSEESFRNESPLLSEAKWEVLLKETGFQSGPLIFRDSDDPRYHNLSAIIATAAIGRDLSIRGPSVLIVIDADSGLQRRVSSDLLDIVRSSMDTQCEVISLSEAELVNLSERLVVCLIELEKDLFDDVSSTDLTNIKSLSLKSRQLLWVSRGGGLDSTWPGMAKATGVSRAVCSERGGQAFNVLTLDPLSEVSHLVECTRRVLQQIHASADPQHESEYSENNGLIHIARVVPSGKLNEQIYSKFVRGDVSFKEIGAHPKPAASLSIRSPGLLDSLEFKEDFDGQSDLQGSDVEIEVMGASLNFRDLMVALGQIAGDYLGSDACGIVRRIGPQAQYSIGDRVLCHSRRTLSTYVRCSSQEVHVIPPTMSFEKGAAMAAVFNTAYYSLVMLAKLSRGETVLIHSAAGGVGQAAIQIARVIGANIIATVGNDVKKSLLQDQYHIPEERILYSRDTSFVEGVRRLTDGHGVDVVLNSLTGELLQQSFLCTAPFGRFVELGKQDIDANHGLAMSAFSRNVTFTAVDFDGIICEAKPLLKKVMLEAWAFIADHPQILEGPQPLHCFHACQVEDAFRLLQSGETPGKVVVTFDPCDKIKISLASRPTYYFSDLATYMIAGGLGGLGRSIIRWMITRGARNFLIPTRSDPQSNEVTKAFLQELQEQEVQVSAPVCDISDFQSLHNTVQQHASVLPPVKGCIQASMVLKDNLFENMTSEDMKAVQAPKVAGSWNLHRALPADLDFFILLSSFAGVAGSRGQANYAAGNVYQDALARYRVARGQKAISLNLGLMLGIGYAAENLEISQSMRAVGNTGVREDEFHAMLDGLCDPSRPLPSVQDSQIMIGVDTPETLRQNGHKDLFAWMYKPLFRNLHNMRSSQQSNTPDMDKQRDNLLLIGTAQSVDAARDIIIDAYIQKLLRMLSLSEREIDVDKPVHAFGVDSLLAVEVRFWFLKEFKAEVAVSNVLEDVSIIDFCHSIAETVYARHSQ